MSEFDKGLVVRTSKLLSYILRHGAHKEGIPITGDGWVKLDDLLQNEEFKKLNIDENFIKYVVDTNDKQRFKMEYNSELDSICIRANQGHSISSVEVELKKVTSPEEIPVVVHGTYAPAWEKIRTEGLKTMTRQYVHFASGLPGESGVISGMRGSANVLIYIDVEKAIKAGIEFFISENGVILSKGIEGTIPPCYFLKVTNRKGEQIE
ncbi:putative phosphotransferase KptA [Monocercomonoides exilis]|uniref:putative phosphotransferase KptA n=1 Tax=Monocercomonoides exilis TaxID=2049356 RepID=UPI00355A9CDD|nr:putative phosphotransferase KptA [Monocercomonoides exilis]|eukprot:MONOS_9667.1-p1 / transcript=MONOS_9667.1 / gene=MONOS_9667 / organism=Monocercomonoides_exilis_PA203 / gene_product=phosphotransferase KptA / transcript_product=phosphotransferase KptA / location=Mono_scaffold00407:40108-40944(+) / protein_length=207 / sequence_SO=supercontig / SO=protein_coding / is_pseudo=false